MKKFSEYLDSSKKVVNEANILKSGEYQRIIKMLSSEDLKKFRSAAQSIVDSLQVESDDRAVGNEEILDFISTFVNANCI
jgi:hypothetical protein